MVRRSSFCSSELPSAVQLLDRFFDLDRSIPVTEAVSVLLWGRHAAGEIIIMSSDFSSLAMAQLDGSSERRKAKKRAQLQKKKTKKPPPLARKEEDQKDQKDQKDQEAVSSSVPEKQPASSTSVTDAARPDVIDGSSMGPHVYSFTRGYGSGVTGLSAVQEQQPGETTKRPESPASTVDTVRVTQLQCQTHGRSLCQFSSSCCVHKPVTDCGCPPKHSCCCTHHFGDCCHCVQTPPSEGDGDTSRTVTPSAAPAPATSADTTTVVMTPPSVSPIDQSELNFEDAALLSRYLVQRLERSELCDFHITLRSKQDLFWPLTFLTHKVVVARSPLIHTVLQADPHYHTLGEIVCLSSDNFCLVKPFELVVQYLYGLPLLRADHLQPITLGALGYDPLPNQDGKGAEPVYPFSLPAAMVDLALCYGACGAFFYLPPVVNAGFNIALGLLGWETVEWILHFGLHIERYAVTMDTGATVPSSQGDPAATPQAETANRTADIAAVAAAAADTGQTPTAAESARVLNPDPETPYPLPFLRNRWAPRLITAALEFVIKHITADFALYRPAQSDNIPDRIPYFLRANVALQTQTAENAAAPAVSAAPVSNSPALAYNPRLAGVKFGTLPKPDPLAAPPSGGPSTEPENPAPEVLVPSIVLLGLPFAQLQVVFTMMAARRVLSNSLAQGIIMEREARRLRALKVWGRHVGQRAEAEKEKEKAKEKEKEKAKAKQSEEDNAEEEVPEEVQELGYREFYSSKGKFSESSEVEMEITLEREWVGFE